MALIDLAHTSVYGPNNPGEPGTGNILGPNIDPIKNAALGNPKINGVKADSLLAAAGGSIIGPTIAPGTPGASYIPDPFGNIPSELG